MKKTLFGRGRNACNICGYPLLARCSTLAAKRRSVFLSHPALKSFTHTPSPPVSRSQRGPAATVCSVFILPLFITDFLLDHVSHVSSTQ